MKRINAEYANKVFGLLRTNPKAFEPVRRARRPKSESDIPDERVSSIRVVSLGIGNRDAKLLLPASLVRDMGFPRRVYLRRLQENARIVVFETYDADKHDDEPRSDFTLSQSKRWRQGSITVTWSGLGLVAPNVKHCTIPVSVGDGMLMLSFEGFEMEKEE